MIVIGVDPGGTTGLFVYDTFTGAHDHRQLRNTDDVLQWVNDRLYLTDDTEVAVERFVIGRLTATYSRQPQTLDVIAAVQALCNSAKISVALQTASEAKSFAPNALLRRIGWYLPTQHHATDAARHTLLRLARRNLNEFDHLLRYRP